MRRLVVICLVGLLGLVVSAAAYAQTATQTKPPAKPATPPPTAPPQTPSKPAEPAASAQAEEAPRSLFEQTWRQFEFGGRLSSIDGDPARFQRFRDKRDGIMFTDARYANEDPDGAWLYHFAADNVGWRDQRF